MSEVIYELKVPFSYSETRDGKLTGEQVEARHLTLFAPTYRQIDKVTPLKQAFAAAITEVTANVDSSGTEADPDSEIEPAQAMQLLYTWSGDATKALLHAAELFKSGAALVDGEAKVTGPILDKMSDRDFEGLVGTYLVNFIVPSLTGGA